MPVKWAIASQPETAFDAFSTRCRLRSEVIRHRSATSSKFTVCQRKASDETVALCRVVPTRSTAGREWFDDKCVTVSRSHELVRKVCSDKANCCAKAESSIFWIPSAQVRHAVSVCLEAIDERGPDAIHQLVQDTVRRNVILCEKSVVCIPIVSQNTKRMTSFRVVSTYPAQCFVVARANTRVSLVKESLDDNNKVSLESELAESETRDSPLVGKHEFTGIATSVRERVGGMEEVVETLIELLVLPLEYEAISDRYGVEFPRGLLVSGPPGVGKTLLVSTAVKECERRFNVHLEVVNGANITSTTNSEDGESVGSGIGVGDAELALRQVFAAAKDHCRMHHSSSRKPLAVIFLDEIDALCPKREGDAGTGSSMRVVAQLLTLLDGVDVSDQHLSSHIIVIGATNQPHAVDPALRRPGRFDREISLRPPNEQARTRIFEIYLRDVPCRAPKDQLAAELATRCVGYVGADIAALVREATETAVKRASCLHQLETAHIVDNASNSSASSFETRVGGNAVLNAFSCFRLPRWFALRSQANWTPECASQVTKEDFNWAMTVVQASCLRSTKGHLETKASNWDSIGGHEDVKQAFQQALEWPLRFPKTFERLRVQPPRGILLFGPPGCSKSSLVRVAASSSNITFLSLSIAQVFSPFFGDAEAAIRQVFADARAALPAIVFFDELDALVMKRQFDGTSGDGEEGGSSTSSRILSTLLNEMDGVESARRLLVIGATNRPECIDAALLRPGRFDRLLHVKLPEKRDRKRILEIHSARMKLADDVDLAEIAARTDFFSGAELENVCREAALNALREAIDSQQVAMRHLMSAVETIQPVSSPASIAQYEAFGEQLAR